MVELHRKGRMERITRERLSKRDYYRLQVNLDRRTVAFGYYAIAHHYPRAVVAEIRNYLQEQLENSLKEYLRRQIRDDGDFRASIANYIETWVSPEDPELQSEARAFFESLGWAHP